MSKLRPELTTSDNPCPFTYESAYYRVYQAVAHKRALVHGKLHSGGQSCAIGSAFDDGVNSLPTKVIDEIAAYNDSFPKLSGAARWRKVRAWLKFRIDMMRKPQ